MILPVFFPYGQAKCRGSCAQVDRKAHAQIAVVTIKTIDDDPRSKSSLPNLKRSGRWRQGDGSRRSDALVMKPRRGRIEVGYGLEGILNDAKVGDIGRSMVPAASQGDYNTAIPLGVQQIAQVIAKDAGVTLTLNAPSTLRREPESQPVHLSLFQVVLGGGAILLVLIFLVRRATSA